MGWGWKSRQEDGRTEDLNVARRERKQGLVGRAAASGPLAGPGQQNQAETPCDARKEVARRVTLELTRWMDAPMLAGCSDSGVGERWHTTEGGIFEKNAPV